MIHVVFFISGVSALIYQVLWVRQFGQIFGNTTHSAALITGIFILGLGLGSFLVGKIIDRFHEKDPVAGLKFYAYAELLIALLGFALTFAIPLFGTPQRKN